MHALAQYVMRGPLQAGTVAAAATAMPFMSWLGGAVVSLVVLRLGLAKGLTIGLWALLPALGWVWFTGNPTALMVIVFAMVMAGVLRATMSWERALLAGSAAGLVIGIALPLLFPGMVDNLVQGLVNMLRDWDPDLSDAELDERQQGIRALVHGILPGAGLALAIGATVLARYWQAALYNPGGFRQEFHGFRLTVGAATLCVVALLIAQVVGENSLLLSWMAGMPLIMAGLALAHGVVGLQSANPAWLVLLYVLLVVAGSAIGLLLMLLAIVDSWLDIRRRISSRAG